MWAPDSRKVALVSNTDRVEGLDGQLLKMIMAKLAE